MDPELKNKLVGYLDRLDAALQKGADFAGDEIPKLVQEWLVWLAVERFCYAACWLAAAGVFGYLFRRSLAWYRAERADQIAKNLSGMESEPGPHVFVGGTFALTCVCCLVAGGYALSAVKVIVAPRVVLVEQVAGLVKEARK